MSKSKSLVIILIALISIVSCIGCNHKKKVDKSVQKVDNNTKSIEESETTATETTNPEENIEIVIDKNCTFITEEVANEIANEIKDIMTKAQENRNKLENFKVTFDNQKEENNTVMIDVTTEYDCTTIRKPEDDPVIIGMNSVVDELIKEEDKESARAIISGYIAEIKPLNSMERLPEYSKVRFNKDDNKNYELLTPEGLEENDPLYPMREYYEENCTEDWDKRKQLGRETLWRDLY